MNAARTLLRCLCLVASLPVVAQTWAYGPYGFSKPGFGVQFLHLSQTGNWRVEWFTVHRETHAERLVQSSQFQLNP